MGEKKKVVHQTNDKLYTCTFCCKDYSTPVQINEHVFGYIHRKSLMATCPSFIPLINSFQHFLDTYLKDMPILGLEYIEEIKEWKHRPKGWRWRYVCHLCDLQSTRRSMIEHITAILHTKKYLERHHPEVSATIDQFKDNSTRMKTMNQSVSEIISLHGRKEIRETELSARGVTLTKVGKSSSSGISLPFEKSDPPRRETDTVEPSCVDLSSDPAPSQNTKSCTPSEHLDREDARESGIWKNLNLWQFKNIDGFLSYMRDFEIQNEEDAMFVKIIVQNCIKALVKFQEEQESACVQGATSSSHQASEHARWAVAERVSHSPETPDEQVPSAPRFADSSSLESEAVGKSDVTETFFSNIKNMEASEVSSILDKVAATNPAFKGIDVSNMIKYLQETGRLKKP